MLIQPDSFIRLIKKCPLDKTYEHTIYFDSEEQQVTYFKNTLEGIPFNKQSYQRYASGVLHVQAKTEDLYECNYLMFQNGSFGSKYFYAFITSIEYVNNVSSRVTYEIDVMQTWFFNYNLCECFVEREHTVTDEIGDNLIAENLETGEYTYSPVVYGEDSAKVTPFSDFGICVVATFDKELEDLLVDGYVGNMYTGLCINYFDDLVEARRFIASATTAQKADGLIAVFMTPKDLRAGGNGNNSDMPGTPVGLLEYIKKNLSNIDGYEPVNNKLFTSPYNSLFATNNDGNTINYAYEYFYDYPTVVDSDYVALNVINNGCFPQQFCLMPWFYKGLDYNHLQRLTITNSPQCAFTVDGFGKWFADNTVNLVSDSITGIAGLIASAFGGGILAGGAGFHNVSNVVKQVAQHYHIPPTAKGSTTGGALNINTGYFGFSLYYCTIRKEYAKIIDSFFDRYGYAVHEHKIPNRNVRPYWTFTKTSGCVITGAVPADDMVAIRKIYDNGITFWRYNVEDFEVGNYSTPRKNKPVKVG